MPQLIESGLSENQKENLEIEDLIFHIIDPEFLDNEEGVIYLDEVDLQKKQTDFFLDRLRDIAQGTQYIFRPDSINLKERCRNIVTKNGDFVTISRQITSDFAGRHSGQMSAGVFVVASVKYLQKANSWKKLVLLVKMDKSSSFSYTHRIDENGRRVASMDEIKNSLNENKKAIQKSAVIDVSDVFAWDVLAYDRITKPILADYYKEFLGVSERQEDSELTRLAYSAVRKWANQLSEEEIPEGEDSFSYIGRSLNYLQDHDTFDTEAYLQAVVRDPNRERKQNLVRSLQAHLVEVGIAGQTFSPKPNSIPRRARRQTYLTQEGVTITFEGDKDAHGLKVQKLPNGHDLITIETQNLKQKT